MAANATIRAAFPEVKKHKTSLFQDLTQITFPFEDRNGDPLRMSVMPGLDYILEAADDTSKFYRNRMSPAMSLALHLVTGVDYKGAKDRPQFWSFETFSHLMSDLIPFPMIAGGMERMTTSEKPSYEAAKYIGRSLLGLHNHPTYPVALRDEEDFLKNEAAILKQRIKATAGIPIIREYYKSKARDHDEKVREWIKKAQNTDGADKILGTYVKYQNQLLVGSR
jgi:hypothetical protein